MVTRLAERVKFIMDDIVSRFLSLLCVPGSFQALIQYADMLSAQTAKFVSIHLTLFPLCWSPFYFFLRCVLVFFLFFFRFFFFYFVFLLFLSYLLPLRIDGAYPVAFPRDRSKFSVEYLMPGKYFPTCIPFGEESRDAALNYRK